MTRSYSLEHHAEIAKDGSFTIKVLPSWRPDKAFNIEQATFNDYMAKLAKFPIPTLPVLQPNRQLNVASPRRRLAFMPYAAGRC